MKDNVYRNAVDHLQFSHDLESAVLSSSDQRISRFRMMRLVPIAALVCLLLASTVLASDVIAERFVRTRKIGTVNSDFTNAKVMEFSVSGSMQGIEVHEMELKPKGYYLFGEGYFFHPSEGFLRVTENYTLEKVEDATFELQLKNNGKVYSRTFRYVAVEGGIIDEYLGFYPVKSNEFMLNLYTENGDAWPVYVNLENGKCRDVLSGLSEKDFWPKNVPSGYDARITGGQPYKGGILMHTLVSGIKDGNSDSESLYFWVQKGTGYPAQLEMPDCHIAFVVSDTLCYMDAQGNYFEMDDLLQFRKVEVIPKNSDVMNQGLVTIDNEDGTVDIYDLVKGEIYHISGLDMDAVGYNASRKNVDGQIVLTRSYPDYPELEQRLDYIGVLDVDAGLLRQIAIDSDYHVQTHGWLDDTRYVVIYEDGLERFLSVYTFEE